MNCPCNTCQDFDCPCTGEGCSVENCACACHSEVED